MTGLSSSKVMPISSQELLTYTHTLPALVYVHIYAGRTKVDGFIPNLHIISHSIRFTNAFYYLGSILTTNLSDDRDIVARIRKATRLKK
jgi:hypothetical protein